MKIRFKIVPDAEPNAPGEWKTYEVPTNVFPTAWSEAARLVCDRLPEGHHFIQFDREAA